MSLFPGYASQDNKPSTSGQVKKEDPEDEREPEFTSFSIAKAAREKAEREKRNRMTAKIEKKKDSAAVRRFNIGDTSDEDELTMTVDRSESEDENTRRIYAAQRKQRIEDDQLEQRKRKNRERVNKHHKYEKNWKIKRERSSSSDSDSSGRKPKKAKKEEKDRDRYIKPEIKPAYDSKSKNWHFLATTGVTVQNPNSYMIDERRPDPLIKAMEKTETRECARYDQRFSAVLGAPYKINKLFFPAKTTSRTTRVLDKPVTLKPDPECEFLCFAFDGQQSTIDLSTVRCDKQIKMSEEPTESRVAARTAQEKEYEKIAQASDPLMKQESKKRTLAELSAKRLETNAQLRDEPRNEVLWMEMLRIEDQMNKLGPRDTVNSVAANERKEAIVKKALTHLPKSANLIVENMKLKKKMDVPVEELNREWKAIMNRLPNSLSLWQHRLNEMKHDSKQFNRKDYMAVLDQATNDLKGLVQGTMKSHKPEPGTVDFLVDLVVLRVRMELAMGYIERAISTSQVLIECNIFAPPLPIFQEFVGFKEVWEGNLPLVGEPGGRGWFHYRKDAPNRPASDWMLEIKEASEKYSDKELVELGRAAEKEDEMVIFARHERIHEQYYWRPVRSDVGEAEDDFDRRVELTELQSEHYPSPNHLNMAVNIVKELGGLFYGKMLSIPWEDPTGPRLFSLGLLDPSLHVVPVGLPQFIDRLLHQMAFDDPVKGWTGAITMSTARIRTQSWFIAQRENTFDMAAVIKELNGTAESGVTAWKKMRTDVDLDVAALFALVAIYEALNLFEANYDGMNPKTLDKAVKVLVKQITSKALVWSSQKPFDEINRPLNKSVVLILATLLIRLPGSWDERRNRVECVLLGKDKNQSFSIKEQTDVLKMLSKVREGGMVLPDASNSIHIWLSSFFGFDGLLTFVLDAFFLFANASVTQHSRVTLTATAKALFEEVIRYVGEYPQFFANASADHFELFYMYYVQMLKYGKNEFRQMLNTALQHHEHCSTNTFIVREYIDSQQKVMNEVSMLAELKRKAEDEPSLFNSLMRLYAHRKQFSRVVASAEMQSDLAISDRVIKVFIEEAKRNQDPLLWRYTLKLASEFKNRKLGGEVFTQAFADCSWSRALHIDNIEYFPSGEAQILTMNEKHIRIRGDPENVKTYIDHAKNVDGRE